MSMEVLTQDEELKLLEVKLNQLKLDYEKYFIGNRPTEPAQLRSDVQKTMIKWSNTRITNSALRFKFNSLNGRYQAFKRQWDGVLRQIEAGTVAHGGTAEEARSRNETPAVPRACVAIRRPQRRVGNPTPTRSSPHTLPARENTDHRTVSRRSVLNSLAGESSPRTSVSRAQRYAASQSRSCEPRHPAARPDQHHRRDVGRGVYRQRPVPARA